MKSGRESNSYEELSLEGSLTLRGKVLDSERRLRSHQMLCILPAEIYFLKSIHLTDPKISNEYYPSTKSLHSQLVNLVNNNKHI